MGRIGGFLIAALALVAACNSSTNPSSGPGPNQVFMQGSAFNPTTRTVAAGTTVTWVNKDGFVHNVTYSSGVGSAFNSGSINGGGTFQVTFSTAGTVQYYCTIHGTPTAGMRGTIVVQ
jgi:plastocyanin